MLSNSTIKNQIGIESVEHFELQSRAEGVSPIDHSFIMSRLLVDGVAIDDTEIVGHTINKQFKVRNHFLLFTNWGCTYEKNIEVTLLDSNYRVIDNRSIEWPDDTVKLEAVVASTHDVFELHFSNGRVYDLKMRLSIFNSIFVNSILPFARKLGLMPGLLPFRPLYLKSR